ncbi:MAG: hypothetical protein ABFD50_04220 [Smithella sp.]
MKKIFFLSLLFLMLIALPAHASQVYWTDWASMTTGIPGSASGTINISGNSIMVSYSGEIVYINQGNCNFPAYMKAGIVDNKPTPANESIGLKGGNNILNTITFSQPVINPIFAIQSLGSGSDSAEYVFTSPFTILNQGPGAWGGNNTSLTALDQYTLYGKEGNGILQFTGTYSSLSWTVPDGENFHMFTVGAVGIPSSAAPIPAAAWFFGPGLIGLIAFKRRFTN